MDVLYVICVCYYIYFVRLKWSIACDDIIASKKVISSIFKNTLFIDYLLISHKKYYTERFFM